MTQQQHPMVAYMRRVQVRVDVQPYQPATPRLAAYVDAARRDISIRPVPADVQTAAWEYVRSVGDLLGPATQDDMAAWLGKLAPKVRNAPTHPDDVQAVYRGIWEDCSELPRGVWCVETRRSWGQRQPSGVFWPAAGELRQHLADYAATIRNEVRGCEKILAIANEAAPQEEDPRKDPAQQEAVRATMAAWRAEQAARQEEMAAQDRASRPVTASLAVSDHTLLAIYEVEAKRGTPGAAVRVKHLRAKTTAQRIENGEVLDQDWCAELHGKTETPSLDRAVQRAKEMFGAPFEQPARASA